MTEMGHCEYVAQREEPESWCGTDPEEWCLEHDSSKCLHESVSDSAGEPRCIFHLPPNKKPDCIDESQRFITAVETALNAPEGTIKTHPTEFVGATFGTLSLDNWSMPAAEPQPIILAYATFKGPVSIHNTRVKLPVATNHATFENHVEITSTFEHGVDFHFTEFEQGVTFNSSTFKQGFGCFEGDFQDELHLTDVIIDLRLRCAESHFGAGIEAENVTADGVGFNGGEFHGPVTFGGTISGDIDFSGSKFHALTDHQLHRFEIDIEGDTKFSNSTSDGSLLLSNSSFHPTVYFEGGVFRVAGNAISFGECEFHQQVFMYDGEYEGWFMSRQSEVGADFDISHSRFEGLCGFQGAEFEGDILAEGAVFNGTLDCGRLDANTSSHATMDRSY
jgi:hypothetical protein